LTDTLVPHFAADGLLQRSQSGVWQLTSLAKDAVAGRQPSGRAADDRVESLTRVFVPRMVADRVLGSNAEWLAEFRVLTVVFVQLAGLESTSLKRIQDAVLAIEEAVGPFGLTMFDLAVDDRILDSSPARRITMPKRIRKVDDTYADQDVVRKLFQAAGKRDRIILRIFVSCGLRPQETFALRANDIETGRLRVDEALKQAASLIIVSGRLL